MATATKTKKAADAAKSGEVRLRIRVRAYENKVLDNSVKQIMDTALRHDATILGPTPLPTEIKKYTVNRSPFIYKNTREQFEIRVHKRVIDILNPGAKTIEALTNLSLPSGVEVDVRMLLIHKIPNAERLLAMNRAQTLVADTTMKFIVGTKVNMTEYFAEDGKMHAATIVTAGPVVVTQIKNNEKDGYSAVQVGFGFRKEKNLSQALMGHFAGKGTFADVREFRVSADEAAQMNSGDTISTDVFAAGDVVTVSGTSKAKGFQGVIKRHNFKGGPRSHGQKHSERAPGSIGGGLRNRVPKGMRMGGRTGGERITVSGLKVLAVDAATNTILIQGAIPGRRGTLLEIVQK